MDRFTYSGDRTKEISFPLGGIGTGCIGLAGNGRLIDWEIFNRPNKGGGNGFSHFAIKAEAGGKVLDARILNGDLPPPYTGTLGAGRFGSYGHGVRRDSLAAMPHFRDCTFRGEFPFAELTLSDRAFPGRMTLTAFNPFIPLNDRDSGLPAAFFEFEITNPTRKTITYTLAGTLKNPLAGDNHNRVTKVGDLTLLHLGSRALDANDVRAGDFTLVTDARTTSHQEYWFQAPALWFGDLEVYWRDFTTPGKLANRRYTAKRAGRDTHGTIAARVRLAPGKRARLRFVIAWSFPTCENYWDERARDRAAKAGVPPTWRNYYATLFPDSRATARYALTHWNRLHDETRTFKGVLFSSDLPPAAIDAISANLSILKSPTVLRLEDGTFYGWEGCHPSAGCCEGTCTHVWNYAQALPFLFPKLERTIRDSDFTYNQGPAGDMAFRMELPLGSGRSTFRPCADGQFGGVLKTYRDWKVCGDTDWLRSLWPAVKKSIEFAWSPRNADRWDPDRTGVLHGRQHHTLDVELFGPNAWLTGFYLGALKAGAEMADALAESDTAADYRALFERGRRWVEDNLFNGDYYVQEIDLGDKSIPHSFGASDEYWDPEHREIRFQMGDGCATDQLLAQWHADLYGLGDIFDRRRAKRALRAIFRHNFKDPLCDHVNPHRIYGLNDEAGLVICDWPEGARKPWNMVPYAPETFHGFEYAAAALMIRRGLVREGMKIVEAVRDRYDGERRNPWNEFECGSNYARSMASYSLLNAFSGFEFDLVRGLVGFNPVAPKDGAFSCLWSLDSGWGLFEMKPGRVELRLLGGSLRVESLNLPFLRTLEITGITLRGTKPRFSETEGRIDFARPITIEAAQSLTIRTRR